jgi:predicted nucleotidyltransferase
MKFHDYLEQLFSNPTSIALIRALIRYKGKVFTIRGLSKVARVSSSQSAVVIGELERLGVVTIQPVGRSSLVSLNEKSYILNRIMRPMIRAEQETLEELVTILKRCLSQEKERNRNTKIIAAVLFGSLVRHEEREESDIDLFVVSNDFESANDLLSKAREQVASVFGNRLSPVIMSERELKLKRNTPLVKDIEANHINVAGRTLEEVLKS